MKSKNILSIVVAVVGVIMIFISMNIMDKVESGRVEIYEGQQKVDRGSSLFNTNPVTKEVGKGIFGSAQRRIDEGTAEADKYQQIANWLKIGGIILVIAGVAGFFFYKKK